MRGQFSFETSYSGRLEHISAWTTQPWFFTPK